MICYKTLYIDQPEKKTWHRSQYRTKEDALTGFMGMWNHYPMNVRGFVLGDGERRTVELGVIRVDETGNLIYQEGTEIRVLANHNVRIPKAMNLLPPELRRPT